MTLPRILIVSHTYTAPVNRAKLDALAQHSTLTAIIPNRWQDALFTLDTNQTRPVNYVLHTLAIRFNGHILRYLYPWHDVNHIILQTQPDLIYVEEEPASLVLTQFALLKRRAKLVCFTCENIFRHVGLPGIERYNLAQCDGVIAGNRQAAEIIRRKKFAKPILITPQLGIDPDFFKPTRSTELRDQLGLEGFIVGYIGRLVEEKGLGILIDAVAELPEICLLIIGSGPLREKLEQSIATRNLAARVRIVPSVSHDQIPLYLNALDVLALPSQTTPVWKEQFGHVLVEAMACAVPVVGSDSGAIPKVIGDAGLIFPEGNANSLRDAIVTLRSNSVRCEQLAQAGRARVLAQFTHAHIAAANIEFFKQVLAS